MEAGGARGMIGVWDEAAVNADVMFSVSGAQDDGGSSSGGGGGSGSGGGRSSSGQGEDHSFSLTHESFLSTSSGRALMVAAATVIPSAAMACIGPQVFYDVIRLSGSFLVPVLFCVAPPAMAWAVRYGRRREGGTSGGNRIGNENSMSPRKNNLVGTVTTAGREDLSGDDVCPPGCFGDVGAMVMPAAPPWLSASEAVERGHELASPLVPGGKAALVGLGGPAAAWVTYLILRALAAHVVHS